MQGVPTLETSTGKIYKTVKYVSVQVKTRIPQCFVLSVVCSVVNLNILRGITMIHMLRAYYLYTLTVYVDNERLRW